MDNQELFHALQKTLIEGLAQTENRILHHMTTEIMSLKNEMNHGFKSIDQKLTDQQLDFETDVSNEILNDKQQLQYEIEILKQRIKHLEKKLSAM